MEEKEISLADILQRLAKVEQKITDLCRVVTEIKENHIKGIYVKLNGRPSWAVSIIITFLSCLSVGLIVRLLVME